LSTTTGPQPFTELTRQIEALEFAPGIRRIVGRPLRGDLAVTGQSYIDLITDTPRLDRDMALVAGIGLFESYARNRIGTLYWHSEPTIERVREGKYWGYRVAMRLLISDNPVVSRLMGEAEQEAAQ
jgi:hypothetical protein